VPKLWAATIAAHHRTVRDTILDTTTALATRRGVASLTMSQIADAAGVGRATLYKYFADVEAILVASHERHVERHLAYLTEVRGRSRDPATQLEAVLAAYATIPHERARHHGTAQEHAAHHRGARSRHAQDVAALVHRTEHVAEVQQRLVDFLKEIVARAARAGVVRRDVPADELARYCLNALAASGGLPSETAVRRLVAVTLAGLRPERAGR
jgi:AcrR family transcriptional regulator